ncbi:Crp/Fnr family transcriptional regulator [Pseudoteredinibacter isoporae]|uniref:CRP-like cAMP-binding protein n=1 Tax=Pseudoteredinibacter isoporae TaxID=570281 RepID=A0A7X0MX39_9GAMM|nr:Crp/Fnr family transcriptional regulator [Pseudoteredinibacter isoporae]MBB6520472.1 CRP-like cAMP-binding protein [Pseudoteredinibacter isoporae]NHO86039.1 Crp/Fnr family transcriptional regulator [Pseudoteredinibacter isoporae]NIB25510.1 Crp/Fnr family transcriptional regulator [Pseudoteredinibacter isoporae]
MALLEPLLSIRYYADGELIFARGEYKAGLCIVLEGSVKVGNYGKDGRYFLSKVLKPYESFGEFTIFSKLPRTHTAEAYGESKVGYIGPSKLKKAIIKQPEIALQLLQSLSTRLHMSLEVMDDIKRLPVIVRIAKVLFELNREAGGLESHSLSQEEIASQLGVSRMVVSSSLKELSELGLIEKGYRAIRIPDTHRLLSWIKERQQIKDLL